MPPAPPVPVSVYEEILAAVHAECVAAAAAGELPGLAITQVVRQTLAEPTLAPTQWPCLIVAPAGGKEVAEGGTNLRDDVRYPVRLTLAMRLDPIDPAAAFRPVLQARERLRRRFHHRRLASVPAVYDAAARSEPIVETRDRLELRSSLTIEFTAREGRN